MIITVQNEYRVEAELTENELSDYGITYDELDYGNIETRRVLWSIFDDIKKKSGIEMGLSGKMLIEVMKESREKYRICFTSLSPREDGKSVKQLVKSENPPLSAEFVCFEDLLSSINSIGCVYESSLYEKNGKYTLLLIVPAYEKARLIGSLCEFSECRDNDFFKAAECAEHWKCLISENAVRVLRDAFSVKR